MSKENSSIDTKQATEQAKRDPRKDFHWTKQSFYGFVFTVAFLIALERVFNYFFGS